MDNPSIYSVRDMVSSSGLLACVTAGSISLAKALETGDGGPVAAIVN